MPTLLAPRVTAPLSECSGRVEVKGQVPGATVHVFADDELIVEALSSFSELELDLPVSLTAGASVVATQSLDGDESTPSPEPVIVQARPPSIGSLVFESTIYECGACVALSGAIPGATLEVHALDGPDPGLRGTRTAAIVGNTKVSLDPPADTETSFVARQIACGDSGPDTPMQAVFPQAVFDFGEFNAPTVVTPLYACQRFLTVRDVFPGAIVDLERSEGPDIQTCFAFHTGTYENITSLVEGESIQARQSFPGCQAKSGLSDPVIVEPASSLPAPIVIGDLALCEGTKSITISNLVPGATVRIFVDGEEIGIAGATFDAYFPFPVESINGSEVTAQQGLCDHWSPLSKPVKVVRAPRQIPEPKVPEPLYECGGAVLVHTVKFTWVTVYSTILAAPIGEGFAGRSGSVAVKVNPLLIADDDIFARVKACGRESKDSEAVTVQTHPAPNRPTVPAYLTAGMRSVKVEELIPGAYVEIFVSGFWRGGQYCVEETASIPISGALVVDDYVAARQRMCLRVSEFSQNQNVVPPAPTAMFSADPGSGEAPLMVSFTNHSTGTIDGYQWFFDWDEEVGADAPDSEVENPIHLYEEPGSYVVQLIAVGPTFANASEKVIEVGEPQPDPPDRHQGAGSVAIYNCHSDSHSVSIWLLDHTAGSGWEERETLAAQWDQWGTCGTSGTPFVIEFEDGHIYEIRALDLGEAGCGDDPLLVNCQRWIGWFLGQAGGPVAFVNIA